MPHRPPAGGVCTAVFQPADNAELTVHLLTFAF